MPPVLGCSRGLIPRQEYMNPMITTPENEADANFEIVGSDCALSVRNISKYYRIWSNPTARLTGSLLEVGKRLIAPKSKKGRGAIDESHSRSYRDFHALQDISFDLNKGESLGIIGLNGSGKSTLLQIIAGTLQANEGQFIANGRIAALLELGSGFSPEFTGKENVYLNASLFGLSKQEINLKYDEIVSFADIGEFIDQPVKTFSSGMVIRLAFAVIAHVDADILLIDEALAVGDARFQAKCFRVLDNFREQGKTIVFVSHDVNSVARLCSRAILLHQGSVFAKGPTASVINEYSKLVSNGDRTTDALNSKATLNPEEGDPETSSIPKDVQAVPPDVRKALLDDERSGQSLTQDEFSFGGEIGQIEDIEVLDEKGLSSCSLRSGQRFVVNMKVHALKPIGNPIYAMTIRSPKGQEIYGQNTLFARITTQELEAGEKAEIAFEQVLNLAAGEYLISLGFTRLDGTNLQVIHRRYDAVKLTVHSTDGSFGIANCHSRITCNPIA